MSEKQDSPTRWSEATDPDGVKSDDLVAKDWILQTLIAIITGEDDDTEGHVGITLTYQGGLISGDLISGAAYRRELTATIEDVGAVELASGLSELATEAAGRANAFAHHRRASNLPNTPRRYVHLKNAQVALNGETKRVPLWRGTLADITGWFLGEMN